MVQSTVGDRAELRVIAQHSNLDLSAIKQLATDWLPTMLVSRVVYLQGPLGAGKTTWVRSWLAAMGYQGIVKSPTYSIIEHYQFSAGMIHHLDCYRLSDVEELEAIGIRDFMGVGHTCLVEWPECGFTALLPSGPDLVVTLAFDNQSLNHRTVTIAQVGSKIGIAVPQSRLSAI